MLKSGKILFASLIALALFSPIMVTALPAQEEGEAPVDSLARESALKVFIEGFDNDYLRDNIGFVNYVRDPRAADLHIIFTGLYTASGGVEYTIEMLGRGRFAGMNDTLRCFSGPTDVYEETRANVVRTIKMGLMRYVARTPLAAEIDITSRRAPQPRAVIDPWDSWVFRTSASGGLSGNQREGDYSLRGSFSASRVTEALKIDVGGYLSYREDETALTSRTLLAVYRTNSFDATVVKSVTDHWSAGGFASIDYSSYGTRKSRYAAAPAVEYSVFRYEEASSRAITFLYRIEYSDVTYHDVTIYDKISERLWRQAFGCYMNIYRTWGSAYGSVGWSQYLHDTSINSLSGTVILSIRLFRGFNFDISGTYTRNHDLIDQPRRDFTDEEILLNLRRLSETYSYSGSIGFSYTFGSIYSNVVNPRF